MALTMGFSWRQWWTEEPSSLDTMGYGIWTYGWWWLWWWRSGPNNCWLPPSSSLPSSSWSSRILRPPESWIMRRNAGSRDHVVLTQRTSWQLGFLAGCQTSHLERLTQRNDYLMLKSMFCMFQLPIGISDPTMWMAELPKAARTPGPLRNWKYFGWLHSNLMASWKLGDEPPQLVFFSVSCFGTKNFSASQTLAVIAPAFTGPGTIFCNVAGWNIPYQWRFIAGKFMYKLGNCDGLLPESTPQIVVFIGKTMLNKWNPGMGVPNCQTNPNGWKMNKTLRKHYVLRNLEQRANSPLVAPRLGVHAGSASRPASWKHGHQQLTVFCSQNNPVPWTA